MRLVPHAAIRAAGLALPAIVVLAACTGSSNGSDQGGSPTTPTGPSTSSTAAPVLLAVVPNLALNPEQCFAEVDSIVTTPTTIAPDPPTETTGTEQQTGADPTTEPTSPDTLPETTVVPRPAAVAVVDCGGTHSGQVYAAFCLGTDEDSDGDLTAVACPGDTDLTYPGDRNIRRAAARICLQRFEETFGEPYASSDRVAQEFTPTEGVWGLGDHRAVCHATLPEIE